MSPSQLPRRDKKIALITHVLLFTISIAVTHGVGHAQLSSGPQKPTQSPPATAYEGVEEH